MRIRIDSRKPANVLPADELYQPRAALVQLDLSWRAGCLRHRTSGLLIELKSLDLFVQGTDGQLYEKYTTNGGSSWTSWQSLGAPLGGKLTSSPAATSPASGVINVFVRGSDGALWQRTTTNGGASWSAWASIGGQLASGTGPAVCSQGSRLTSLYRAPTTSSTIRSGTARPGRGWKSLGGGLTTSPGVTSQANGKIDVFVRGTDGAIWYREYLGNLLVWLDRSRRAGSLRHRTSGLLMERRRHRRLRAEGTDGVLDQRRGPARRGPSGNPSAENSTSSPAATSPASGVINVFVRGSDNAVWEKSYLTGS